MRGLPHLARELNFLPLSNGIWSNSNGHLSETRDRLPNLSILVQPSPSSCSISPSAHTFICAKLVRITSFLAERHLPFSHSVRRELVFYAKEDPSLGLPMINVVLWLRSDFHGPPDWHSERTCYALKGFRCFSRAKLSLVQGIMIGFRSLGISVADLFGVSIIRKTGHVTGATTTLPPCH